MAAIVHSQMLKLYSGPRSISGSFGSSPSQSVVTAYLSTPSCVLSANADGLVEDYTPASTTIVVEVSGRTDTANWTISTTKSTSVGTVTVAGATVSVAGMTDDAGWVDITATKAGYEPVTRRFTLAKVRQKGGVRTATTLPLNPSEVGGELAIFLDVADPALRGLYGWSGTEWVSTSGLLDGSVTADKLADDAIQATKFANGIEPISIVGLLPNVVDYVGTKLVFLTTDNKIYRYTGSNWVKELPAEDLTGQIVADQLASNSVTTGKIQAGAVSTDQLAARAVTASKLTLTDTSNIYPDYDLLDSSFYSGGEFMRVASASFNTGAYVLRIAASAYTVRVESRWFQVEPDADYLVEISASQSVAGEMGAATAYVELAAYDGGEAAPVLTRGETVLRRVNTTSSARSDITITTTSSERRARIVFIREAGGTGVADFGGPVIRRRNNAQLIVDGSIVATKIATDAVEAHHIIAGAVTAEKLAVNKLSAITADMGDVTAGTFTLSSTGYIRGGATDFSTGAGVWMGYDAGTYKLRAGVPGSSGFEWTGSAFNVRGPDGSITISSGVVDWEKIAGANKPEGGATRNAYRGGWTLGTVHKKGDIVVKDGSGWIAKLDHTADALSMPPTLPTESNDYWGLYAAKGDTGEQPVTGLLTNEAVTLAATSSGTVTAGDFTNYANGVFQVYSGHELVTPTAVAYSVLSQTGCTGTIDASGNYAVTAMSADTATLALQAVWSGVTIQRDFTLSKSKAGAAGSSATAYSLTLSAKAIKRDALGAYSESTVNLSAYSKTGTGSISAYSGRFKVSTSTDGVTFTAAYTSSANQSTYTYTIPSGIKVIRCELFLAGGVTTLLDSENVVIVEDGKDASYVSYVFRESATAPATPTGTAVVPVDWLDSPPETPTYPVWMSKAVVDGVTDLAGTWSAPIRVTGADGQSTQFQYAKNTSVSTAPTTGWSDTAPTLSAGEYLWMRSGTVVPPAATPSTWGAGYRISGEAGSNAAMVRVRADSQVFRVAKSGTATPASVTINADLQNLTGNATFSITGGTLTGTGNARTLTYANMTADTAVITVTHSGLTDKITIVKVREGADGTGVTIKGSFATAGELPASGNIAGDAYLVAGYLYVWTGSAWNNVGLIQGPKGDDGADGIEGTPALSGFLTNESQTLAANSSGTVSSYALATGTFKVFLGTTDITTGNGVAYSVVTQTSCVGTIDASTGVYSVSSMSADTATLTVKAVIGLTEVVKVFSLSKSRTGATGASAKLAVLTASSQIFQVSKLGVATPASITLTAYGQNLTGSPTFTVTGGTVATLGGSGNSRTIAYSDLTTDSATIQITWGGQTDVITIAKIREGNDGLNGSDGTNGIDGTNGLDGLTVIVSNEAHTVPASSTGAVSAYTNSGTTIKVYEGITALTAASSATANGSFTIGTPVIAPSAKITVGGRTYSGTTATVASHSAMDAATDSVVITYPITVKRLDGSVVTLNRTQTITKSKAGEAGANSIVGILSNETHSVPASSTGVVQSLSGATTTMTIFNGTADDSANWTYSVVKTGVTCAEATTSRTQTVTGMTADVGYVDFTASRSGYASVTKRFTITKSKAGSVGSQGEMGPTVTINPSRAATFTATDGALDNGQSNIVFTATVTGIASPTYAWSFSRLDGSGTTPTSSTSSTYTVTQANFGSSKAATVTCTVNPGGHKDTYTIVRLEKSTAEAGATLGADWDTNVQGTRKPEDYAAINDANILPDGNFVKQATGQGSYWTLTPGASITSTQGESSTAGLRLNANGQYQYAAQNNFIPARAGDVFFVRARVFVASGSTGSQVIQMTCHDGNKAELPSYPGAGNTRTSVTNGSWQTFEGKITISHASTQYVRVRPLLDLSATAGYLIISDLWVSRTIATQITSSNVSTYIANAAIGNAQIGGDIYSTNWTGWGGAGWKLERTGNFYGNNIYARGNIEASSLKANTAMVNRANIVNAAVDTLQIEGNAVTIPVHSNPADVSGIGPTFVSVATVWINALGSTVSLFGSASVRAGSGETATVTIRILAPNGTVVGGGTGASVNGTYVPLSCIGSSTLAGTYTLQVNKSPGLGNGHATNISLFALGTKR